MITNNTLELAPNLEAIQGNPTIHHHQVQAISLDQMHLEHGNYVILGPSHHVTTGEPLSEVTNVTITSAPSGVKIEVSKNVFINGTNYCTLGWALLTKVDDNSQKKNFI